jgi:hypothetical protein
MKNLICLLFIIMLFSCNEYSERNIKELAKKYTTASTNHDIETLFSMTHDSIVWKLGPYTLKGKEAALGPNKYDKGVGSFLKYQIVRISGDTVDFELYETNDIITAVGMKGVTQFPRFIFKNGLLYRKEAWKKSRDIQELNQRSKPRREWVKLNHPEVFDKFFDSEGNFIFNEENGELQVRMSKEWR